jgi:hypothetical protein
MVFDTLQKRAYNWFNILDERTDRMKFQKATKQQSKLRLAIFGPSGSGKTFSALRIATGLGGKIALVDTERGSASKYADRFAFDVLDLPKFDIATYVEAIKAASEYDVLVIDSLTHGWQELLQEVEKIARSRYGGNTWSAWSDGTPLQRKLVDAILSFPGHIIATMRSKTEWTTSTNGKGRTVPVRVGLAPEQGKGIEYEFDILMELNTEHSGAIIKDRTGKYQDAVIELPGEQFGQELNVWLEIGEFPKPEPPQSKQDTFDPRAVTAATFGNDWTAMLAASVEHLGLESADVAKAVVKAKFGKTGTVLQAWEYLRDCFLCSIRDWAILEMTLTQDALHEALGVTTLTDFAGTKSEAMRLVNEYIARQTQPTMTAQQAAEELEL